MTIEFHCPHCGKMLKTADDKAGVQANCPGCGESVTVPSPGSGPAEVDPLWVEESNVPEAAPGTGDSAGGGEAPESAATKVGETRPCPMCGEKVRREATRCRFCGENLVARDGVGERFEAGAILTRSWEIFQKNLGILIGSTLVLLGISAVTVMASYAAMIVGMISIGGAGRQQQGPDTAMILILVTIVGLMMFFVFAVNAYLQGGFHLLLLRVARGDRATLGDMFTGNRFFWRLFWGNVLFTLLSTTGLLLFFVPYVFVILIFWPFGFLIVDEDVGVIESFRRSQELTHGNLLQIFILLLAAFGIYTLGAMACYVGLIFSIPLMAVIFTVAYCRLNGQATAGGRQG